VTSSMPDITDVVEVDESQSSRPLFSIVSLLNVLDRCDNPKALLESAISSLRPGGHLLLSIVLPFRKVRVSIVHLYEFLCSI